MSKLTLSFKEKVLKTFPIPEGDILIGSDPTCHIHIDSLAVQPRHTTVTTTANTSVIQDLGSPDGTFVNNQRLTGPHTLKDDETIRVGKHTLTYEKSDILEQPYEEIPAEETFPRREGPKSAWLQILTGSNLGKTISLNRSITNLGKTGVHTAVIVRDEEGYYISHLEGEHPTLLDGNDIGDKRVHLADGNIIQIGNVKMQFTLV